MVKAIWRNANSTVWATLKPGGALEISGQILSAGSEYEYWLTVEVADVDKVTAALGGAPGADVLALVDEHADAIVRTGEKTWLEDHSIPAAFWSRYEPAD
jgi:hypothetical protein